MRILGIDPGSRATGYGVVGVVGAELHHVASGVIRVPVGSGSSRLATIQARLRAAIESERPDVVALESVFTARNARSALRLGEARGAALAACGAAGLEAAEYAPGEVKSAVTGYGAAGKPQVQEMVRRLLCLDAAPPTDAADALAVAICHARRARFHSRVTGALQRGAAT